MQRQNVFRLLLLTLAALILLPARQGFAGPLESMSAKLAHYDMLTIEDGIFGIASTYDPFAALNQPEGFETASGEFYDPDTWTAAIRTDLRDRFGGIRFGRNYRPKLAGQVSNQAVSFFETGKAGTVTIKVAGAGLSSGAYTVEATLPGDVNGDGQVNLADEQAFAKTYVESRGDKDYEASADYNQNGIVNLYDALAMERNMTPLTHRAGGWAATLRERDLANLSVAAVAGELGLRTS